MLASTVNYLMQILEILIVNAVPEKASMIYKLVKMHSKNLNNELIYFKAVLCHVKFNHYQLQSWVSFTSLPQEKLDPGVKKEMDGMGVPDIKYGDSVCYIQHVDTCLWLTYQTVDAKCARMGGVQRKVSHW